MFDKSVISKIDQSGFEEVCGEFFMDGGKVDYEAVHSFFYGVMVELTFKKQKFNVDDIPVDYPQAVKDYILQHHHYYTMGRTFGNIIQLAVVTALAAYGVKLVF